MNKRDLKKKYKFFNYHKYFKADKFFINEPFDFSQHFDDILISLFAEIANSNQQTQAKHCS